MMKSLIVIIAAIIVGLLSIGGANTEIVEWQPPYFMDANVPGVNFTYQSPGLAILDVQEELPVPFNLLIINYPTDESAGNATIGKFTQGDFNLLGAEIVKYNSKWYIQINDKQDYERKEQQKYQFEVFIKYANGEESIPYTIIIKLINIFDEKPIITYNGPCSAKELQSNIRTNCTIFVKDPDGMLNNQITMDINEKDHFSFEKGKESAYTIEYYLSITKELEYDQSALYNLNITASDIANNTGVLAAIFVVISVPHKPPVWAQSLVTATFDEKTEQIFNVRAVDGDIGINQAICYRVDFAENENYSEFIAINELNGTLNVGKIDRDARKQETYRFTTCAYKCKNITSELCDTTIFIVRDVNDNLPEITIIPNDTIRIHENASLTLPLDLFEVQDIDLGTNATFEIILSEKSDNDDIEYSKAFDVIPKTGYQNASFQLIVLDKNLLDYETEIWQSFVIRITAKETHFPDRFTFVDLPIELINWNDEVPTFKENLYDVSLLETVGENIQIGDVVAVDRDIGDTVIHEIIGNFLGIGIMKNGTVYTTAEDVFDYDRLKVVMIQIKATDTLTTDYTSKLNQAITQLTINVIDVNNKTPEIRMPKKPPNITENSVGGTLVTNMILATDPDTTAKLVFTIDWDQSYATKAGSEADKDTYENCFIIEVEPNPSTPNSVYGHLKVNPDFQKQVDYEKYENMYLLIRVTDLNQEVNDDSSEGTLTVTVDDVNDNPPEFVGDTLNENRFVVELAASDTLVGSIMAIDIDGPGNNNITYSIGPVGETLPDLVEIGNATGIMRVVQNAKIDCDVPKVYFLELKITLTDGVHITTGNIKVAVTDINNKTPQIGIFQNQVAIYENATSGKYVGYVNATDNDRDEPHNILEYYMNFGKNLELEKLFKIDREKGEVFVELKAGHELDRDNGVTFHEIRVEIADNYLDPKNGDRNTNFTVLTVTLLDVNDNSPEMPKPEKYQPRFYESAEIGAVIKDPLLIAPDKDQPNHPNSWVAYRILSIEPDKDCQPNITDFEELFGIRGDNKSYGEIFTKKALRGYYGSWFVHIEAFDHGTEPKQQFSNETYTVAVTEVNFEAPKIVFPNNQMIRLSHKQTIGRPLYNTDRTELQSFEAYDPDGNQFGNVTFTIHSSNGDDDYFKMIKQTRDQSELQITKAIETRYYWINVKAEDGGNKSTELKNLSIVFIDMEGDPIFEIENSTYVTDFTETELGLEEERLIPEAYDPKNQGIETEEDLFKIYYFIDYNSNPGASCFELDSESRILKLKSILNRTETDAYEFRVIVTNNKDKPPSNPNSNSILTIQISVNDVNNNPPRFVDRKYGSGITTSDYNGKEILKVHAVDPDLDDPTTYLMNETIIARGSNIEEVKNKMFDLNKESGSLKLKMKPFSNMTGYFEFNITAIDTADHTDEANVKIYIIAEANRIAFTFLSPYLTVMENKKFLTETLELAYGYDTCNIDDIVNNTNNAKQSSAISDSVSVRVHFINNNEAIKSIDIQTKSDLSLISTLRKTLGTKGLILDDIENYKVEKKEEDVEELLTTMLIVVSVVLGTLSVALVVALILKTKKLNRQLKAFAPAEFGSTASNMNRIGAPTTNVYSAEGSNPVINDTIINDDFETSSIDSDGSDFVGINNDPNFMQTNENSSKNSSVISRFDSENNSVADDAEQHATNGYIRKLSSTVDLRF